MADPLADDYVELASIEGDIMEGDGRYLQFFTGLVDQARVADLIGGEVGHDVSASGPHPVWRPGYDPFEPRFWIHAGDVDPQGFEPLVLSWNSGNQFVLEADPRLLMTYGLVPRMGDRVTY